MYRLEQFLTAPLALGNAVEPRLVFQHLEGGEEGIEDDFLRDDPDRALGIARVRIGIEPPDLGIAARLAHQPGEDVDQRRLARAIRAQQSENPALRHVEADALQRQLGRFAGAGRGIFLDQIVDTDRGWGVHGS